MAIISTMVLFLFVFPLVLFVLEFFLCKRNSKLAIILPVITACSFIFFGFYSLVIAGLLYLIYFIMRHLEKERQAKLSELEKMQIIDLD